MDGDHPVCNRIGRLVAVTFALGLASLHLTAPCAFGCGGCTVTSDLFQVSHPKSLDIAIATRRAIDQGILPPSPGDVRNRATGRGLIAAQQPAARYLAEAWRSKQKFEHTVGPVTVHFLFIDTHEVIAIDVNEGSAALRLQPNDEGDIVLVTTRLALRAIIDGQVGLARARELSLLHIDENKADFSGLLLTHDSQFAPVP